MKTIILNILKGLIPMIESVGVGFESDVQHPDKVIIGQAIVLGGQALQFALDKLAGKAATPPVVPESLANA